MLQNLAIIKKMQGNASQRILDDRPLPGVNVPPAPLLYSGGWYGVAMEYILTGVPLRSIPKDHVKRPRWQQELQEVVTQFHGENLVHGDLRDTNIIVENDERVLLVDFDWGGKDGETAYPRWDLNSELQDGRTHNDLRIRKEDDERILAYTFSKSSS